MQSLPGASNVPNEKLPIDELAAKLSLDNFKDSVRQEVLGYKKTKSELIEAVDECNSISQLCALVQHEGIKIQMQCLPGASNIPQKKLPTSELAVKSSLDNLKDRVRQEVIGYKKSKSELIEAVDECNSISQLCALVKHEGIKIQMQCLPGASNIPQKKLPTGELAVKSPLENLKDRVRNAVESLKK